MYTKSLIALWEPYERNNYIVKVPILVNIINLGYYHTTLCILWFQSHLGYRYTIQTLTGNKTDSSTDDQVYIKLQGPVASSGYVRLTNTNKTSDFATGS